MKTILALALALSLFAFSANAQSCNTPVPWFANYGTFVIGNTPVLGPGCNQFQDSGVSITALQAAVTSLQNQVNSLSAPVLLNTLTASNSASLSDTTSITATYNTYQILFENLIPATNGVTSEFEIHSGGAFQTTTYSGVISTSIAGAFGGSSQTSFMQLSFTNDVSNASISIGLSGTVILYNPSQTTTRKPMLWFGNYANSSGQINSAVASSTWNGGNAALDGFLFQFSSGNITSGSIRIYGIK